MTFEEAKAYIEAWGHKVYYYGDDGKYLIIWVSGTRQLVTMAELISLAEEILSNN